MADERTKLLPFNKNQNSGSTDLSYTGIPRVATEKKQNVSLLRLFSYSDRTDIALIILGTIGSLAYGFLQPAQFILMGNVTDDFVRYVQCRSNINCTANINLEDSMSEVAVWYVGFAFGMLLTAWMAMRFWGLAAERQVYKIRMMLFQNIMHQEIGWFDQAPSGELSTNLTENLNKIADGIGGKFGRLVSCVITFIGGYVIGFMYCWQMTLVMLGVLPLMAICGVIMGLVTAGFAPQILSSYAKAGHVAEQSISSIRTVVAFGGEKKQAERYNEHLTEARDYGVRQGHATAIGLGVFQIFTLGNFAISFWYGIKMVRDLEATPGDVMTVFFSVIISSIVLGNAGPNFEALTTARGAAFEIFQLIGRRSKIDASSQLGSRPEDLTGNIEFSNVEFYYPTRPTVPILKRFNLRIPEGKKVAIVGESGCGKSTIIKLLQRFYDPQFGIITIDGQELDEINVNWLRRHIGVVNQEPVLFATSISENIRFGFPAATQAEIEEAARMANAHKFIMQFPNGYETHCGERGLKMSGGQKQRIAIARALVRDPSILLLDEATSALDSESESIVQDALDRAGKGRTTIIVAHRLSTVRDADVIVAMEDGKVVETGTHDELMVYGGIYKALVKLQERMNDDIDEIISDKEDDVFILKSTETTVTGYESKMDFNKEEEEAPPVSFHRVLKMNKSEWHYILIGCIGCALYGAYPFLFAICLAGVFDTLQNNPMIPEQDANMKRESIEWAIIFVGIGVESAIGCWLQGWMLTKAGEILTQKLRKRAFLAFLRQDISYFDDPKNTTGVVCSKLCTEVSSVQGAVGSQFGLFVSGIVTLGGTFAVAFAATWQLTLLMLLFLPFLLLAGKLVRSFFGSETRKADDEEAGQVAMETFANIQTVVSFGMEERFFDYYQNAMKSPFRKCKKATHIGGLALGATMSIVNISFAAAFRYGGHLIHNGDLSLKEAMTAIWSVILGSVTLGQIASLTPDYTKAKQAANRLFHLLDKVPQIDSYGDYGIRPKEAFGSVSLSNVRFKYPFRRNARVLRNLNVTVRPGQTVALVGTSGCGKSTCMSLVQRFYDVDSGHVFIDGKDVKSLNVQWLRRQIGLVSQEPLLFDLTIRENIAFGMNTRDVTQEEIETAAKAANIHRFVVSLPQGYNTLVGEKGTLISGGQKQRIAIARALIRDPKILLLDEATSALDSESEKVVQKALDEASIGRTTFIIAHRLSTIHNADSIAVLRHGKVVEQGTHQQLMSLRGIYFSLNQAQTKHNK